MRTARAFVLSQGEELLTGQTLDTNTNHLSRALTDLGFHVVGAACAGDDAARIHDAIAWAEERADVLVCTGGLGPTEDDHTAAAVAARLSVPLMLDDEALAQVAERMHARGRTLSDANKKQAMLPMGASILRNPLGTAPGFKVVLGSGAELYCLPGVPSEMRRMWAEEVRPRLESRPDVIAPQRHHFRTIGKPESLLQEELGPIVAAFAGVELGFRARIPEVEVKLVAPQGTVGVPACVDAVRAALGVHCFSEDPERSLAAVIGSLLTERGETVTLAESCTGGLVAHLLISEAGASRYVDRTFVTYSNQAKIGVLGVRKDTLVAHGAVSEEVVREMAVGARKAAGATWAVGISGVAGPGGGTESKPVGTVCVGIDGPVGTHSRLLYFGDRGRDGVRMFTAWTALDLLRRQILRARRAMS